MPRHNQRQPVVINTGDPWLDRVHESFIRGEFDVDDLERRVEMALTPAELRADLVTEKWLRNVSEASVAAWEASLSSSRAMRDAALP